MHAPVDTPLKRASVSGEGPCLNSSSRLPDSASQTTATPSLPALSEQLNGIPELPRAGTGERVDPTIAAVAAERVVVDSLLREALPTTRAALARLADSLTKARSDSGVAADLRTRSEELGRRVGLAVVAWSRGDGFDSTRTMPPRAVLPSGVESSPERSEVAGGNALDSRRGGQAAHCVYRPQLAGLAVD